ncbi:hum-7 [Pristionchus pacificus]|nr:hum-7 [Pristionchus pacificus]
MSFESLTIPTTSGGVFPRRALTISGLDDVPAHSVTLFLHCFRSEEENNKITLTVHKRSTVEELIEKVIASRNELTGNESSSFELVEIMATSDGQTSKERALDKGEYPVSIQSLWKNLSEDEGTPKNRFVLRRKGQGVKNQGGTRFGASQGNTSAIETFLAKFLVQPPDREYADLCLLPELSEQTLLDNLKERFNKGHIYTYIGPILVAVNPFTFFPIYNPKYARMYFQNRRLGSLPPHIFAIADVTYHNMMRIKQDQCIVISGESGSGKTESTNFLLHHLTTLSQKGQSAMSSVEQTLLSAGPVLEAFGNSVTVQNNNSSRFGKFIRVNYRDNGIVAGANVEIYLLEKSRIISQAQGERNYHVFYWLLQGKAHPIFNNGPEPYYKNNLYLMNPEDYAYLNQNGNIPIQKKGEKFEFDRLYHSMLSVGFLDETQQRVFSVISAVLLLGNLNFIKRPGYHSDDAAYIENEEVVDMVANLLHVKGDQLSQALTMRKTVLKNETLVARYSVIEATNTRDAMGKCLYNALFHWIVLKVNQALMKTDATQRRSYSIGILDIFGFEDIGAAINSFEQLCINYANEHLQAYFNQHIFQFEQEEYQREGIKWTNIEYTDNTECVQLFQSKPYGILRLIDEESHINNGTDQTLLDKLNQFLKGNEFYEAPQKREQAFIVAHYAGKVKYQIKGFREKNKDTMRAEVVITLKNAKCSLVRQLLSNDPVALFRWNTLRATFRAVSAFKQAAENAAVKTAESSGHLSAEDSGSGSNTRRGSDSYLQGFLRGEVNCEIPDFCDTSMFDTIVNQAKKMSQAAAKNEEKMSTIATLKSVKEMISGNKPVTKKSSSVSKQFQHSLTKLMKTLSDSAPYFIRCIKSNNEKTPDYFDDNIILRQLRYTGMLETVRIRRAGYSIRMEFPAFAKQYRILLDKGIDSRKEDIMRFIKGHSLIETQNIQYGHSKIFMRDAEKLILDDELHRAIMKHIIVIQRWYRTHSTRRKFLRLKQGIVKMQALVRGINARNKLRLQVESALMIQTNWRKYREERKYRSMREAVMAIQAAYRGNEARNRMGELTGLSKTKPVFKISKIQTFQLPTFNLNDPSSLEQYASSSDDGSSSTQDALDDYEGIDDEFVGMDADATFILEDTKLKLIEDSPDMHRRQSLAPIASTAKMKMLRRAASTESEQIIRGGDDPLSHLELASGSKKKSSSKIGFIKAKKNLRALFGGKRSESGEIYVDDKDSIREMRSSTRELAAPEVQSHSLKASRLHRAEPCAICANPLSGILAQAHKCIKCKMSFHKDCSTFASSIPCMPSSPLRSPVRSESSRRPWDLSARRNEKRTSSPLASTSPFTSLHAKFNLTKTKQQIDPSDDVVTSSDDLRSLSLFIFKKQSELSAEKTKRDTVVDALFKKALKELHMELIGYEAVFDEDRGTLLKYKDLINMFEGLLTKVCKEDKVIFPTTLGVNAFRGFLNEFMQQQKKNKTNKPRSTATTLIKSVRKKRRKSDVSVIHNGHRFRTDVVHVPTFCESCDQFMWHGEKIFICSSCRISAHKKCHTKIAHQCPATNPAQATGRFFGAPLSSLSEDDSGVPILLSKLLVAIEVRGLFTEGIYRKSGSIAQVRQARAQMDAAQDGVGVNIDDMQMHVLTTLVKSFLRELSDPIMSYDLYENFLNVSEVEDAAERIRCLTVMVDLLPKHNKCVLDRLIYHMARIAHQDSVNRMNAHNLALIFGPCLMRRKESVHAQDQLQDVNRQAICVASLVEEKLRQYRETLNNIVELEGATEKVTQNIRLIDEKSGGMKKVEAARQLFVEQLDFLDRHKDRLIHDLPPLAPVASSEDLSSSSEHSNVHRKEEEYAIDMEGPPVFSVLNHLTKNRPRPPSVRRGKRSPSCTSTTTLTTFF